MDNTKLKLVITGTDGDMTINATREYELTPSKLVSLLSKIERFAKYEVKENT